jgi:hypothetical protein
MSRIGWCLAMLSLIAAEPALAWSSQGHMATGLIAYDRLAVRDPGAIAAIEALIAQHPDSARFESALAGLDGAERERRLFALIARWPDDIRSTPYNHTHWHHQVRVVTGWKALRGPRLGEADHGFRNSLALVRDAKADPGRRAIALCWLFHIVGDMHQPLHAGQRMDARFPLSDLAGTVGWIRREPGAAPEPFHHFWDTAADRPTDEWTGALALAQTEEVVATPEERGSGDILADYKAWVKESERLAAEVAYPDAMEAEAGKPEKAGELSADYVAKARAVAEQRLGQAGERLADLLAALFPAS